MGREAHVTRLALGRSPFGEPLSDDNGEFILGLSAYENDDLAYKQQFDERGHPKNRNSKSAASKLRQAQNDVLVTVGVVVKEGEDRKTAWERLKDDEKYAMICEENHLGSQIKVEDRIAGVLFSWPVVSLRNRLMTFSGYSAMPLYKILANEFTTSTPSSILAAGLPIYLLSNLPQLLRLHVFLPSVESIVNYVNPWKVAEHSEMSHTATTLRVASLLMHLIEMPLLIHATLQSLQLIPAWYGIEWKSLLPFTVTPPVHVSTTPADLVLATRRQSIHGLLRSPAILYFLRDFLYNQFRYRLYALFRQILTKPDWPDPISAKAFDENGNIDGFSIAGIGCPWYAGDNGWAKNKRWYGPRSFFGALRQAFPFIYKPLNVLSRGRLAKSRGRLPSTLEKQLKVLVSERYWDERTELDDQPRRGSPRDLMLRQLVVQSVFESVNLNDVEELVDSTAWTNDVLGPKADVQRFQSLLQRTQSTTWNSSGPANEPATSQGHFHHYEEAVSNVLAEVTRMMPLSDVIIIQANDGQVMILAHQNQGETRNLDDIENIHTIDAIQVPLEAFIQGARTFDSGSGLDETPQPPDRATSSPQQISLSELSRAISYTEPHESSLVRHTPHSAERPAETNGPRDINTQHPQAEGDTIRSPRLSPIERVSSNRETQVERQTLANVAVELSHHVLPMKRRQYRVSTLSNHAADSLAWHASGLISSLAMLPLEALWLQSIATWAVENVALRSSVDPWRAARLGVGLLGRPTSVVEPGATFGGTADVRDRFGYVLRVLVTLGLEGIIRGICWATGVWYVRKWKDRYGWGHF